MTYYLYVQLQRSVQSRSMRLTTITIILGLAALASGCTSVEWKQMSLQPLRSEQGYVVGQKELLCDCKNGERIVRLALFEPRFDDNGVLVGYEEKVRGGTVLRDLNGRRIGTRFVDARTRANNPHSKGLTIIVHSQPAAGPATASATTIDELVNLAGLAPYFN